MTLNGPSQPKACGRIRCDDVKLRLNLSNPELTMRYQPHHLEQWHNDGFVIIEDFFTPDEIAPLFDDFEALYGRRAPDQAVAVALNKKVAGVLGKSHPKQFQNIDSLPYEASIDLNLISLHPAVIALAKAILAVSDVHLYQSHTWAKFTGEADYDQPHHCDFGNHTLTVPSDLAHQRSVDFIAYITDVQDDLGALHYVTKPDSNRILGAGEVRATEASQAALKNVERSATGRAGTLVAHSIDTFHRGTNLIRPEGRRYTMTFGYKAAGNDMIGYHVWQSSPQKPWERVLNHASPEQLACLGIPKPGADYWTPRTLRLTQDRWPGWDLSAWRARSE
jgi:hypothetical protein